MKTLIRAGILLGGAVLLHMIARNMQRRAPYRPWLVEQTHQKKPRPTQAIRAAMEEGCTEDRVDPPAATPTEPAARMWKWPAEFSAN